MAKIFFVVVFCIIFGFNKCSKPAEPQTELLIANAGSDQEIIVGSYAVFDPTQSSGDFEWYDWQQDENNPQKVKIYSYDREDRTESNINKIVFTKEGSYKFMLIVRSGVTPSNPNGTNASEPDTLVIKVKSNPNRTFEDPNLEAIIRAKINIQTEELDENALLSLDSLSCAEVIPVESISSLKGLENCKNLIYLHLGSQDISDISPLSSLTKLKNLWLDQNYKIGDVAPLAELIELEELNIDCNLLTDISPLKKMINLEYLSLEYNAITGIAALENMSKLKKLWMSEATINDLLPISKLDKLELLWFNRCNIENISCLKSLSNIKILKIAWNKVGDISSLSNMEDLEWVALEQNQITDISPLQNLSNLSYVRLWDNQITDIKPLVDNSGIGNGDIVGLDDNPLDEVSINEYIPVLQARGVLVTW